jgi:HD-GYP domain-containing protein (c-di-GMP phosphodiesterase class II)
VKARITSLRASIRPTVVAVFLLATLLTAALAIGLQFYFARAMAYESSTRLYRTASSEIAAEVANLVKINNNVIELLAANPLLGEPAYRDAQLRTLVRVLEQNPIYYGIYLGHGDGSFFEVINLDNSNFARQALGAAPADRWVIVTVQTVAGERTRAFEYLDETLQSRTIRTERTQFEATARPWYTEAMNADSVAATKPYLFAQLGVPGLTLSKRITPTNTVVGIDMTLTSISHLLQSSAVSQQSETYLFDAEGKVIASSLQSSLFAATDLLESAIPDQFMLTLAADSSQHATLLESTWGGIPWLVYVARTGSLHREPLYLGIRARRDIITAHFMGEVKLSMLITAGLLLLFLPLSWFFANPIVNPVRQLARENDKVRRRDYAQVKRVPSHVKELDELSESMMAMVESIQAHELAQRNLMDSFIQLIAQAIDDKSAYTGGHCERVPELAMMLAQAASDAKSGAFGDFELTTEDQWREYHIAAWLHDCGKITTPEHIVDKGSKLEAIYNRLHEVRMRFEVLWRDAEIDYLKALNCSPGAGTRLENELRDRRKQLLDDFRFVAECNVGGEFMDEASLQRLRQIGSASWQRNFDDSIGLSPTEKQRMPATAAELPTTELLLSDKPEHIVPRTGETAFDPELGIDMEVPEQLQNLGELYNLCISRGTLTREDRFRIQEHMISTIKMLESLPFPEELQNVPRYASTHHETLKGTGYPRKLDARQLSIPERILAIADIFEALTASDRPYKQPKTISESLDIMLHMVRDNHIDRDCFELFVTEGVYLRYAQAFLQPEQIDEVDVGRYVVGQ